MIDSSELAGPEWHAEAAEVSLKQWWLSFGEYLD